MGYNHYSENQMYQNEITLEESKVSQMNPYSPDESKLSANIQNYHPHIVVAGNQNEPNPIIHDPPNNINKNNLKVIVDAKHGGEVSGSFCSVKTDDIPNYKIEDNASADSDVDMDMDILEDMNVTDKGPKDDDGDDV